MGALQQGVSNILSTAAVLGAGGKKLEKDTAQTKELEEVKDQQAAEAARRELENKSNIAAGVFSEKKNIFDEEKSQIDKGDPEYAETRALVEDKYRKEQGDFGTLSSDDLVGNAFVDKVTQSMLASNRAKQRIEILRRKDPTFRLREQYANGEISSFKDYQTKVNEYYLNAANTIDKNIDDIDKFNSAVKNAMKENYERAYQRHLEEEGK